MGLEVIRQLSCCSRDTFVYVKQNCSPTTILHPIGFRRDSWKMSHRFSLVGGTEVSDFHSFVGSPLKHKTSWISNTRCSPTNKVRATMDRHLEVRVCLNKACRKSGSLQTLDVIRSLAPPNVSVESCSCLGKCGNGPNLVILPAELMVSHCSTAAHAARLLSVQCGAANPENNLTALALKEQGNQAFEHGDVQQAEKLYSQAIEINPSGGLHFIHANRSAARLARGDAVGALEDARQAVAIAPKWAGALVREAEAHAALGNNRDALAAYRAASQIDTSIRRSRPFQHKVKELESKLVPDLTS